MTERREVLKRPNLCDIFMNDPFLAAYFTKNKIEKPIRFEECNTE